MTNSSCKNCVERHFKCHSTCQKYKEFLLNYYKEKDLKNKIIFEDKVQPRTKFLRLK